MKHRITPEDVFGADFETDNDGSRAWVCQWCIHGGHYPRVGRTIETYGDCVLGLLNIHDSVVIYFHNLKYDLEFQKSWLHDLESDGWEMKAVIRRGSAIKVRMTKGPKLIELRDSLKKMPYELRFIGKLYDLPKLESPRGFYPGWSNDIDYSWRSPDWDYIRRDAEIVAVAMKDYHRRGFNRTTQSGDAWACAKQMIGSSDGKVHANYPKWDEMFPKLPFDLDCDIRAAYMGGVNYSANKG